MFTGCYKSCGVKRYKYYVVFSMVTSLNNNNNGKRRVGKWLLSLQPPTFVIHPAKLKEISQRSLESLAPYNRHNWNAPISSKTSLNSDVNVTQIWLNIESRKHDACSPRSEIQSWCGWSTRTNPVFNIPQEEHSIVTDVQKCYHCKSISGPVRSAFPPGRLVDFETSPNFRCKTSFLQMNYFFGPLCCF